MHRQDYLRECPRITCGNVCSRLTRAAFAKMVAQLAMPGNDRSCCTTRELVPQGSEGGPKTPPRKALTKKHLQNGLWPKGGKLYFGDFGDFGGGADNIARPSIFKRTRAAVSALHNALRY